MPQKTLAGSFELKGISLHSGKQVSMEFGPAPEGTGIVFIVGAPDGLHRLCPRPDAVGATELATTISDGVQSVSTIEHVLAGLRGMDVDNAAIHVEGGEVPILDGSAKLVVQGLLGCGFVEQDAPRTASRVARPFSHAEGAKRIDAEPFDGFRVDYTIRFDHPAIGTQRFCIDVEPGAFAGQVACARTFGFLKDVEYLRSHGLARGGSLESVVVVGDEGVVNPGGLRYPDEFVRHKILDFIGVMAMLGRPLMGAFRVECSGHAFNNAFLRRLAAEPGALEAVTLG
ncbi:MAG: UDP-3-O-[3-hydroxymyristoyl] N-acetylglucosamine deacetylase [Mailhella sp.]|nr:UDP-3-O-[3-hydroxymyristoyl] N-acetylglucosamine deacetylase [Mailhella sp.]